MQLLKEGGFFVWPLLIVSIIGAAIIAERMQVFHRITKRPLWEYQVPTEVVMELRTRLTGLQTIITIAPMLGLLGTVTGLMKCFSLLGAKTGSYRPQEISLGISEALITTAVGLVIAVVATVFYNYFVARLETYVQEYNGFLEKGEENAEKTLGPQ
ncbi:MAG TPA: MotA/TolQ/ExbB proton channel family protein [Firmicutes bacterium]|nr:MotA/TolQ/ExbB proton channel family protein [Bacillota bacterium]